MIQIIKHGVVLREFPLDAYNISIVTGIPVIIRREDNKVECVPSPNYYDTIEVDYEYQPDAQ